VLVSWIGFSSVLTSIACPARDLRLAVYIEDVHIVGATFKGRYPTTVSTSLPKFDLSFDTYNHAAGAAQIITAESSKTVPDPVYGLVLGINHREGEPSCLVLLLGPYLARRV